VGEVPVKLTIEIEQEEDGRWIAEVMELSGAMVYGETQAEAVARAQALALQVLADRLEAGEMTPETSIAFDLGGAA
jgi:predicted RNase H-like HicB family nuclease